MSHKQSPAWTTIVAMWARATACPRWSPSSPWTMTTCSQVLRTLDGTRTWYVTAAHTRAHLESSTDLTTMVGPMCTSSMAANATQSTRACTSGALRPTTSQGAPRVRLIHPPYLRVMLRLPLTVVRWLWLLLVRAVTCPYGDDPHTIKDDNNKDTVNEVQRLYVCPHPVASHAA